MKWSIQKEDIILINIHALSIGAKQIQTINGKIDRNTIIVGYFNTSLTMDSFFRHKINKATEILNDTIE